MLKLALTLLLTPALGFAKAPEWVKSEGRGPDYPEERFFTGFGETSLGKDSDQAECKELARNDAKRSLIQSVEVKVTSVFHSKLEQKGRESSVLLSANTDSASTLEIGGLKLETYVDAKKKVCFARAAAEKAVLARTRGMRRVQPGTQKAEVRLVLTTMDK